MKTQWNIAVIARFGKSNCREYLNFQSEMRDHAVGSGMRTIYFSFNGNPAETTILEFSESHPKGTKFTPPNDCRDLYVQDHLVHFFQRYVIQESADRNNRYMVITWGHGMGLGYFSQFDDDVNVNDTVKNLGLSIHDPEQAKHLTEALKQTKKFVKQLLFLQASLNLPVVSYGLEPHLLHNKNYNSAQREWLLETGKKQLKAITCRAMGEILMRSFKDKKVDVLFTLNCFTQMLETGIEMKNNVVTMVSPQTTIPFFGINYARLFQSIRKNPSISVEDISDNIAFNFWDRYDDAMRARMEKMYGSTKILESLSISCNRLSQYETLSKVVTELATQIINTIREGKTGTNTLFLRLLRRARKQCRDLSVEDNYSIIDLTHFLNRMINCAVAESFELPPRIWELYREFLQTRELSKISWLPSAPKCYQPYQSGKINPESACESPLFLSVFFPYDGYRNMERYLDEIYKQGLGSHTSSVTQTWMEMYRLIKP